MYHRVFNHRDEGDVMRANRFVVILSIVLVLPSVLLADSLADDPGVASGIRLLESWIGTQIAYRDVPGITIGIIHGQELVWASGLGYADRENKIPAAPSTIFRIASISKLFTSISIMKLRDEGKLRLDDPVKKHLPWFDIKNRFSDAPVITIRHLITHTSGLPREAAFPYWTDFEFPTREQIRKALPEQETVYPSETRWKYSNLALALAGEIVAAVSGEPYEDYVSKNIIGPLGMTSTFVDIDESHPKLAVGYGRRMPDGSRSIQPFTDSKGLTPAANLSSTVEDFAKFAAWQLRLRKNGGAEILRASTLKEMQRVHWLQPDWRSGWGLGFAVWHSSERDIVGHGGHVAGYTTRFTLCPKENIAVFVMTNADDGDPGRYVDMAYKLLASAITKAASPEEAAPKPDPAWKTFAGKYQDGWSDYEVLVYGGRLAIVFPQADDPLSSMQTLLPTGANTFVISGEGYGELGEKVVFELDASGNVARMKIGENYSYPMK